MLVTIKNNRGFTLLELTVVFLIIVLLLGGLLSPLSQKIEQQDRTETRDYLLEAREALIGFSIRNGRLPCPDCPDSTVGTCGSGGTPNDGIEDMSGTAGSRVCRTSVGTTSVGNIPWVDLQVDEFDAWNRHLTYSVTDDFADETDGADNCDTVTVGVSFELCAAGEVDVYNDYAVAYSGTPTVADNVVALLISHGSDGYEPAQTDIQVENYGRNPINPDSSATILTSYTGTDYKDNIFIMKDYDAEGTDAFDDMVIWLSPNLLMRWMVKSGQLP